MLEQLAWHVILMEQGTVVDQFEQSYGYRKPYQVIVVVEQAELLNKVKEQFKQYLSSLAADYDPYFVFLPLEEVAVKSVLQR